MNKSMVAVACAMLGFSGAAFASATIVCTGEYGGVSYSVTVDPQAAGELNEKAFVSEHKAGGAISKVGSYVVIPTENADTRVHTFFDQNETGSFTLVMPSAYAGPGHLRATLADKSSITFPVHSSSTCTIP